MPDLTITSAPTCSTNLGWSTKVKGTTGKEYTVSWARQYRGGVQYDWECTCASFTKRHQRCKHIAEVVNKGLRCGWNEALEPTEQARDGKCPGCGGEVHFLRVGV